ncbi:MAG: glycosyl transferase [Neisseriaceae bacterium]|nr:MAG: glycosyl transferase [Neisseriaceae bacterium]
MTNVVQTSTFPKLTLCTEKGLYFRHNCLVDISLLEQNITLFQGGILLTNTYFNSVSIGKLKKYTGIHQLSFRIIFFGHIKLTWKVKAIQRSDFVLQENILNNEQLSEVIINLPFWNELTEGMLFFEVQALDISQISSFEYVTEQPALHDVRLGIVITHFNQQQILLPAIERLKNGLFNNDVLKSKISICVIDNSQNLPEIEGIEVIKNPNLGGSGGFSRGLVYYQHQSQFTHCLFMDDDASCEIESIRRTLFYLSYTENTNLAILGAMLRECEQNMQHESGGVFNGLCRSVKSHFNLLMTEDILLNEIEERIDYGAWWFFAFPISKVKYLSFPYFVRGDDISFSLANDFDLLTVNGICSWQVDFAYKAGPIQLYLDQRNHIMHFLHGLVLNTSKKMFLKTSLILFILNALSYQYESAKACTIALQDILKGPDFWRDNIDMLEKRKEIASITKREKIRAIPLDLQKRAVRGKPHENNLTKIIRMLSLNGHLIPSVFFSSKPIWQYKHYGVRLREVFLHKEVIYFTDIGSEDGIVLKHSKKMFFSCLWSHFIAVVRLCKNARKLRREYIATYPELTSEKFWQKQFDRIDI